MKTFTIEITLSFIFGAIFGFLLRTVCFAMAGSQFYLINFLVDLAGSFMIGFIFRNPSLADNEHDKNCAILALLGGLATFSGFSIDIIHFIQAGEFQRALFYFAITNLLAISGCFLGSQIAVEVE